MYKLILFDFFKTLTPNVYFSSFPLDVRKQITQLLFKHPNNEVWEKSWMSGLITSNEVFDYLSSNINYSLEEIEAITKKGIEEIGWNHQVLGFHKRSERK